MVVLGSTAIAYLAENAEARLGLWGVNPRDPRSNGSFLWKDLSLRSMSATNLSEYWRIQFVKLDTPAIRTLQSGDRIILYGHRTETP